MTLYSPYYPSDSQMDPNAPWEPDFVACPEPEREESLPIRELQVMPQTPKNRAWRQRLGGEMTTLETLKAARKKIEDPAHWIQNEICDGPKPWSAESSKWCAIGAITSVMGTYTESPAEEILRSVMGGVKPTGIGDFNDTHTHAEVLAAFDAAIAKLEAR
jgi:hypothetical protein